MLMFTSLAAVLGLASAGYSYGGNYGSNYGAVRGLRGVRFGGFANQGVVGNGFVGGYTYGQAAVAPLAIQTAHQIQYRDVPSGGQITPISVDIPANPIPINMLFRSASSQLNVQQVHQGSAGSVQESSSQDDAHVLRHTVTKPVIQEVREIITPFRRVTQEIQPVREHINTIVARGINVNRGVQGIVGVQRIAAVAAPVAVENIAVAADAADASEVVDAADVSRQVVGHRQANY